MDDVVHARASNPAKRYCLHYRGEERRSLFQKKSLDLVHALAERRQRPGSVLFLPMGGCFHHPLLLVGMHRGLGKIWQSIPTRWQGCEFHRQEVGLFFFFLKQIASLAGSTQIHLYEPTGLAMVLMLVGYGRE